MARREMPARKKQLEESPPEDKPIVLAVDLAIRKVKVVNCVNLRLRKEPSLNSESLLSLPEGTILILKSEEGNWLKVETSDKKIGYVVKIYTKEF